MATHKCSASVSDSVKTVLSNGYVVESGLVTIVLPVYNREKYVSRAIESVLRQTYKKYELIVVDDGSTDSSLQIVQGFQNSFADGQLVIISQKNMGPSYAKNAAIQASQGQYIAFLDSDDFWHEEKLSKQLPLFDTEKEVAFTYTGYCLIDENDTIFEVCLPDPIFYGDIYEKLWKYPNNISGGTIIVEKNKLLSAGLFDPLLKGSENLDLRLRLSQLGHVFFLSDVLYFYRKHSDSLTSDHTGMHHYRTLLLHKHFGKQPVKTRLYRIVQAKYLYEDGMLEFSEKKYLSASGFFIKSIACNPLSSKSYFQLARCCMGKSINRFLSWFKNRDNHG